MEAGKFRKHNNMFSLVKCSNRHQREVSFTFFSFYQILELQSSVFPQQGIASAFVAMLLWGAAGCKVWQLQPQSLLLLSMITLFLSYHDLTYIWEHSSFEPSITCLVLPSGARVLLQFNLLTINHIALICLVRGQLTALWHIPASDFNAPNSRVTLIYGATHC